MSMLLEALRKSEAQRHMGKAPDIHSPDDHRPSAAADRKAPWITVALIAVAAIAITYLVWDQYRAPEGLLTAQEPRDTVSDSPAVAQRPASPDSQRASADDEGRPVTPVETYRAEPAEGREAAGTEDQREALANSFEQYSAPGADATAPVTGDTASTTAPTTRAGLARGIVARTAPRQADEEPPAQGAVSYWELPQNVRDAMPDFNITVMVYAERPEDRFLLMNGTRMMEKEQVEGVRLEKIRRNAAVFRFRNYLFTVEG
ncbi:MAG: general secretion pathway protein GspB [Xanthomonadales bacterium]|nr:general secretion pathway protein GspB [Gammaproteobacteria bacterium]MBT8052083.1 general secretion pathway protein GspB [Gammaproteobacteria bacterium]MBT8055830.1 general secretion pathway protein GspB [Gammaproteobacteria bacterium]NNJ80098.1 general secretion pathway protein GspB [Xanthomonadales bacterium]NNL04501.1 general secretion pathway protein GspB [Xanthomonadales bacterium]